MRQDEAGRGVKYCPACGGKLRVYWACWHGSGAAIRSKRCRECGAQVKTAELNAERLARIAPHVLEGTEGR